MAAPAPTTSQTSTTQFAAIGRLLAETAARHGLVSPGFRSPPRIPGVRRSVTKNGDGSVTVAVTVRDRPVMAVLADMIDGVVLGSGREKSDARELYDSLWSEAHGWILGSGETRRRHLTVAA